MLTSPPLVGPRVFVTQSTNIDQVSADALVFIAQRLAGIEWELHVLNEKAQSLEAMANDVPRKAAKR